MGGSSEVSGLGCEFQPIPDHGGQAEEKLQSPEIQVQPGPVQGPQGAVSQVHCSHTSTFPSDPPELALQWLYLLGSSTSAQPWSALGLFFSAADRISISFSMPSFTFGF